MAEGSPSPKKSKSSGSSGSIRSTPEEILAMAGPVAAAAPAEEGFNWWEFMDAVPGVKGFREEHLDPMADAIRSKMRAPFKGPQGEPMALDLSNPLLGDVPSMEVPVPSLPRFPWQGEDVLTPYSKEKTGEGTVDLGVLANVASGLPGTIAETLLQLGPEVLAQNIEALPENIALPLMGGATPAIGRAAGSVGKAVGGLAPVAKAGAAFQEAAPTLSRLPRDIMNALQFRGGYDPAAASAFGTMDEGMIRAAHSAEDAAMPLAMAGGRATTPAERAFAAQIAQQPGQKEVLRALAETPREINPAARSAFESAAQEVPGVLGSREAAAAAVFPESDLPARTFADMADAFSVQGGIARRRVEAAFDKDPTGWTRFTEDTWFPEAFQGRKQGTFPTAPLRERTGFMAKRQDMTVEERIARGELDPVQRAYDRIFQEHRAATTREMFNDLAMNPVVTYRPGLGGPQELDEISKMASGASKWINGIHYTKMPLDNTLGPLAGQLVKSEEAAELTAMVTRPGALRRTLNRWWSAWKFGKTVLNPKTQIRNISANVMMAHAEGLSPARLDIYKRALRELKSGTGSWQEARGAAAPWTARRRTGVLDDVLSERDLDPFENEGAYEAFFSALPRWMMKNHSSKVMAEGYQDSETLFKHALYLYKREKGVPIGQAIEEANRAIIDYGKMPQWVKQVRAFPGAIPFISFTYGATPLIAQTLMNKPQMFLRYKLFADSWNELAFQNTGATDEERQNLQMVFQGTIPLVNPVRDASGSLMVWDAARSTPVSDVLNPENILLKSPVLNEAIFQIGGVDPRTGAQIPMEAPGARQAAQAEGLTPDEMSMLFDPVTQESRRARVVHGARTVLPAPLMELMNVVEAAGGREDAFGQTKSVPQALLSAIYGPQQSLEAARDRGLMSLSRQEGEMERAEFRRERRRK